ncbi:AraC family transcriptional regulator ligand-binding domain-containing protein [Nocardia sp. NPDC088792]|uniref:AraC family transcriptional regulator ligand-binding domain-containing protein n=1 Tax=Nocardia sp. NPDC088792 TaxID=3364332 RepID=UPI00382C6385
MSTSDSVLLPRFVLTRMRAAGLDPVELARAAGAGHWALDGPQASVPGRVYQRLWELFEHRIGAPHVGLRAAERYGTGELGMIDYLVATAHTVGEGFRAAGEFGGRLSDSRQWTVLAESERETTFAVRSVTEQTRGAELAAQASFAFMLSRVRHGSKAPIAAAKVAFRQPPPRRHTPFTEFFGTAAVDFEADANTLTLRSDDLRRPMQTADPRLAAVLRRGADAMPRRTPPARAWSDLVAAELDSAGTECAIDEMAKRLHTSPRTLQRRLAAAGTSWSRELADARRRTQAQVPAPLHRPVR